MGLYTRSIIDQPIDYNQLNDKLLDQKHVNDLATIAEAFQPLRICRPKSTFSHDPFPLFHPSAAASGDLITASLKDMGACLLACRAAHGRHNHKSSKS